MKEGFNGFVDYVQSHIGLVKLFRDHPTYRLYGEWLVKHTIPYSETSYRKFYLFDIVEVKDGEEVEEFFEPLSIYEIADEYGIDTPKSFGMFENPTLEELKELVGQSDIGEKGEGIVIKNMDFRDKWENHNFAKIVTETFAEDNAVTFGGNNKHSDSYWEIYIANKYVTLARVQKIMHKVEPTIDRRLDMQHIPQICGMVHNDIMTEEIWEIQKKVTGTLSFKTLNRIIFKKAKQVYVDILNENISVADKK